MRGVYTEMPPLVESIAQDLHYAVRGLLKQRGWTLTAVLAAALGIGASTAVFSVVDRLLFRPLPYRAQDRLVSVGMLTPLDSNEFMFASGYFDLRRNPGPFEAVTAFQAGSIACDLTADHPQRVQCLRVEANFLSALGFAPVVGRSFTPEEDRPNSAPVAVISYGLWQSRFAKDSQVYGRTLPIDGVPTTIVGVLPQGFETPTLTRADILVPLALNEATERSGRALRVFGWRKPGVNTSQAVAQLQPYFDRTLATVPPQFRKEVHLALRPIRDRQVGSARMAAWAWLGAVLAVLLIACANIANLLLARASSRERELAVRAALGASRGRLARQALTESLLLGALGGTAGCVLAGLLVRLLVSLAPDALPRLDEAAIDSRVLGFALLLSLFSGLLFGIGPSLRLPVALGGGRAMGPKPGGLRLVLVAAQMAMSLVLLTGAGLLLQSWWRLSREPLGMQADHVITAHFVLGKQRYSRDVDQIAFFHDLEAKVSALPGVTAAAISDSTPPIGGTRGRPLATIEVEGQPRRAEGTGGMVPWRYVTPGYFATLGVPIRKGRGFTSDDLRPEAYSIVVSESLARQLFPGGEALGKHILRGPQGQWGTIFGIAGDVRHREVAHVGGEPEFYLLRKATPDFLYANQEPPIGWRAASVLVRTMLDPAAISLSMRDVLSGLDPTLPVTLTTMRERLADSEARPRFQAAVVGAFATIGLLLAAIGLFGVTSFLVAQRKREIGVRMALGATRRHVLTLTLRQAAQWTAAGLLLGVAGSLALGRLLRAMLFQVSPADPVTLLGAAALLGMVALLAAALPARRAARVDPMIVLRDD